MSLINSYNHIEFNDGEKGYNIVIPSAFSSDFGSIKKYLSGRYKYYVNQNTYERKVNSWTHEFVIPLIDYILDARETQGSTFIPSQDTYLKTNLSRLSDLFSELHQQQIFELEHERGKIAHHAQRFRKTWYNSIGEDCGFDTIDLKVFHDSTLSSSENVRNIRGMWKNLMEVG